MSPITLQPQGHVFGLVDNNERKEEGRAGRMQRYAGPLLEAAMSPLSEGPPACIILCFSSLSS